MIISWNTTRLCNQFCVHCYRQAGDAVDPDELTTAQGLELISGIAEAGFKILILSGGEPLMRPDIYQLIEHGRGVGLRVVLGTNGVLITEESRGGSGGRSGAGRHSLTTSTPRCTTVAADGWERGSSVARMAGCRRWGCLSR